MDYNVKYRIDINGAEAERQLSAFGRAVNKELPPIITQFNNLKRSIQKIRGTLETFEKYCFRGKDRKIRFDIDNNVYKEIDKLKKAIAEIKSKKISITIDEKTKTGTITDVVSNGAGNGNKRRGRGGSNRAAKGFGSGFKGLYGLADVMYAAGFPFPNMIGAAAIGMGTMSIIKDASEYENIMTTVRSILKATDKDFSSFNTRFNDMSTNIRNVGVETKFTATEVAGAAKYLAMAGLNINDINNSIKAVANLAIIGDAPLDRMADVVTNIQTAYGLDSSLMGDISDILTSVTTSTNTNVLEMGEAMKFAAPMMSMAKISFNEAAAAIGALANAGLKGTVAGTALRAMMTRLLNPTKKGTEVLKKYNIQLYEMDKITGKVRLRSLFDIFSQLKANDASIQDLTKLFDKIGGNAGNNIFAELMKLPELIENSIYAKGLANDIASQKQDTVKGKWDKVTSQFTETGMKIFESYSPVIKAGLDNLLKFLQDDGVAEVFRDVASGLIMLTNSLISIGKVVSDNWWWMSRLVVGGILSFKFAKISHDLAELAGKIGSVASAARGLGSAVGGAAAGGGGFLAAIGGIPTVVGVAVGALASLGIAAFTAATKTEEAYEKLRKKREDFIGDLRRDKPKEQEEINNKPLKGKEYFDSLGWDGLSIFGGSILGSVFSLDDYKKAIAERGSTAGAGLGHSYALAALQMDEFSLEKMNNMYGELRKDIEAQKKNGRLRIIPNNIFMSNTSGASEYEGLHLSDIDANTEVQTIDYTRAFNYSLDLAKNMLKYIQNLQLKIHNQIPLTYDEVTNFANRILHYDIGLEALGAHRIGENGELRYNDKEAAKNKLNEFTSIVRKRGIKTWFAQALYKVIEEATGISLTTGPLFSKKDVRIDSTINENGLETFGSGGTGSGSALSGTGKTSQNQPRIIKVDIHSLIGQLEVKSLDDGDSEILKDKIVGILTDAIKDFEISYQ